MHTGLHFTAFSQTDVGLGMEEMVLTRKGSALD